MNVTATYFATNDRVTLQILVTHIMVKRQIHQKIFVYDLFIIYVELLCTY